MKSSWSVRVLSCQSASGGPWAGLTSRSPVFIGQGLGEHLLYPLPPSMPPHFTVSHFCLSLFFFFINPLLGFPGCLFSFTPPLCVVHKTITAGTSCKPHFHRLSILPLCFFFGFPSAAYPHLLSIFISVLFWEPPPTSPNPFISSARFKSAAVYSPVVFISSTHLAGHPRRRARCAPD